MTDWKIVGRKNGRQVKKCEYMNNSKYQQYSQKLIDRWVRYSNYETIEVYRSDDYDKWIMVGKIVIGDLK